MERILAQRLLEELGAKPSKSEERGLSLLTPSDKVIFSPGISTAGFAEIRMAQTDPERKVIATTIDEEGLAFAEEVIQQVGLDDQIETRLEDLRGDWEYPSDYFDFIYARLVLHYLSAQDLDTVLANFTDSLKPRGKVFTVVRSVKNVDENDPTVTYDSETRLTTVNYYTKEGELEGSSTRYFHTSVSITEHLQDAGLAVTNMEEYQERLYKDFMRKEVSPRDDHVIEVVAKK